MLRIFFLFLLAFSARGIAADRFLIEAESLNLLGGWTVQRASRTVREYIFTGTVEGAPPAAGAIRIPRAGAWRLWVRSKDFPEDRPGIRRFSVSIAGKRSAVKFGGHGQEGLDGWEWEDGGVFDLPAGPALIAIGEEATSYARCDALVLTDDAEFRPRGVPWALHLPPAPKGPLDIKTPGSENPFLPEIISDVSPEPAAVLQNKSLQIAFHWAKTRSGRALVTRPAYRSRDQWKPLPGVQDRESYRVLYRPKDSDPKLRSTSVHPAWDTAFSPEVEVGVERTRVRTRLGQPSAPWASGQCFPVRPNGFRGLGERRIELHFPPLAPGQLKAVWELSEDRPEVKVSLELQPSRPGHFSLGYHGLVSAPPEQLDFLLLPFMFQGRRFPARARMLLNTLTPAPLSLVNTGGATCAVVAAPGSIPFEWPGPFNSRYALGIRNEIGLAQPLLYSPVLGLPGSVNDGQLAVESRFSLWIQPGHWFATYRRIISALFQFRDYRRPVTASLSDTIYNLIDLLKNDKRNGWSARGKGPWNIEMRNTVTQASPLTYLSIYLLTGDESFYREYALPSLEFLLSRSRAHFGVRKATGKFATYVPLKGPVSIYGAPLFRSAFEMTHGRSPCFAEGLLDKNEKPRPTRGFSHSHPFAAALALYQLTGERKWLDKATAGADRYIARNLEQLPTHNLGTIPFLNISFTPDWEDLLTLYETTGRKRFLQAAAEGARWILTTLWVQPVIPDRHVALHPGGVYEHACPVWWYGDRRFRLGVAEKGVPEDAREARRNLPPTRLVEKQVPAWQVSQVGLGLEQPCTYTRTDRHANILMSVWAPGLLRLAGYTGDEVFRTAARNATIGRFANCPGYYLDGFTDHCQQPDYPVVGPDVTTIYHHHIPPFTAYVIDYVFTDARVRSGGAVQFPSVRQHGYAWFDNRLYGHAPGKVYGQSAWPWLHKTAVTVNSVSVDVLLAHGTDKLHAILLNQLHDPVDAKVKYDTGIIGEVEGKSVRVVLDNRPWKHLPVVNGTVSLTLPPMGIAVLTLEGITIDVSTHRQTPPAHYHLPSDKGILWKKFSETGMRASGAVISVPPFEWRDLFVYIAGVTGDLQQAALTYQVGAGPERTMVDTDFPWEFSAKVTDEGGEITWRVRAQLPNNQWVETR